MTEIPKSHPRYKSLTMRNRLIEGWKRGLCSEAGLLAHGRGEAFDYLLGERTHDFADDAIAATSAWLMTAKHPVLSVNGNTASLATEELVEMSRIFPRLTFEVNLFHHSIERSNKIANHLKQHGIRQVLESAAVDSVDLPSIDHARKRMNIGGIAAADVVIVALEDGDRCKALVDSGRTVIAIDLNPLSRTAQLAQVSIVDELTRSIERLCDLLRNDQGISRDVLMERIAKFENAKVLERAILAIRSGNR